MFLSEINPIRANMIMLNDLISDRSSALKQRLFEEITSNVKYAFHADTESIIAIFEEHEDHYVGTVVKVLSDMFGTIVYMSKYIDKISKDKVQLVMLDSDSTPTLLASYEKQWVLEKELMEYTHKKREDIQKIIDERRNPTEILSNPLSTDDLLDLMNLSKKLKDRAWKKDIKKQLKQMHS